MACALSAVAGPAWAEAPDNPLGGRLVTHRVAFLAAGYAQFEAGVRWRTSRTTDVGLRLAVPTGVTAFTDVPNSVGFVPTFDVRWQVLDSGDLEGSVGAQLSVPVAVGAAPWAVGVGLFHPGFVLTYRIADLVDLDLGAELGVDLWFQHDVIYAWFAVPLIVGVGGQVAPGIVVGARLEAGPSFVVGGDTTTIPGFGSVIAPGGGLGGRMKVLVAISFSF